MVLLKWNGPTIISSTRLLEIHGPPFHIGPSSCVSSSIAWRLHVKKKRRWWVQVWRPWPRGYRHRVFGKMWTSLKPLCLSGRVFNTVNGQNPAPPRMMIIPLFIGFQPSKWCRINSMYPKAWKYVTKNMEICNQKHGFKYLYVFQQKICFFLNICMSFVKGTPMEV